MGGNRKRVRSCDSRLHSIGGHSKTSGKGDSGLKVLSYHPKLTTVSH